MSSELKRMRKKKRRKIEKEFNSIKSWYISVSGTVLALFFIVKLIINISKFGFPDITKLSLSTYYFALTETIIFIIIGIALAAYGNSPADD